MTGASEFMTKDETVKILQKTNAASSLSSINALSNVSFKCLIWIWVVVCLISLSLYCTYLFWMSSRQKSKTTKVKTHGFRFVLFCSVLFIDSAWCPSLVSSTLTIVQDLNVPAVMEQEDFTSVENGFDLPTCRNENIQLNIQLREKDLIFKNKLFQLFDTCRHFDLLAKDGDAFNKTMVVPSSSSSALLLSNITEMNITKSKENSLCLLIYNFYNFDEQDKLEKNEYVNRNQRVLVSGQETKLARHLVEACPTFLYADDDALAGTDGYNVLTASCTMGSDMTVATGKTLKIKKDPSVVGEISIDRQATSANKGRHFYVQGNLEMEGITLKGGYAVSSISSNILLLII